MQRWWALTFWLSSCSSSCLWTSMVWPCLTCPSSSLRRTSLSCSSLCRACTLSISEWFCFLVSFWACLHKPNSAWTKGKDSWQWVIQTAAQSFSGCLHSAWVIDLNFKHFQPKGGDIWSQFTQLLDQAMFCSNAKPLKGLWHGQVSSLLSDSEAYHEQMGPIPSSNGSLDIALSNAHT